MQEGTETPIEVFTEAVKKAGYDGVKFSYKQGKYRGPIPGISSASEFVCFSADQVFLIDY